MRPVDVDQLDLVGRTEAHVGAFAGVDVTNDRLDKSAQISRRAMMHFEDNGGVAIVFYRHSFAEIVCCGHEIVIGRTVSADSGKCRREQSVRTATHRLPSVTDAAAYSNLSRVRSCESTMPTGDLLSSTTTRSSIRWRSRKIQHFDREFVLMHGDRIQRHQICDDAVADSGVGLEMPDEIAVGENPEQLTIRVRHDGGAGAHCGHCFENVANRSHRARPARALRAAA